MSNLNKMKNIIIEKTLKLDCGKEISNFPLAYETYGNLNEKKDNAILIFHALTGDQYASGINPITKKRVGGTMQLVQVSHSILINFLLSVQMLLVDVWDPTDQELLIL